MNQISPQELFPIVYVLGDPSDNNTYYVRSVLRNSASGALIATYNLITTGNRRFTKNIQAPNDPSGQGFWIDIVTTVYNDSGYTDKATPYLEQTDKYIIQSRWNYAQGGAAGMGGLSIHGDGSDKIDYKKIKEVVSEAFSELPTTEMPETDLSPVLDKIEALGGKIEALDIPQDNTSDIKSSIERLGELLMTTIRAMKFINFKPVLDKIDGLEFPEPITPYNYADEFKEMKEMLKKLKGNMPEQSPFLNLLDNAMAGKVPEFKKQEDNLDEQTSNSDRVKKLMSS